MANPDNNKTKAIVQAEIDPSMKEAYKKWWQSQNFATEAEAIRYHIRQVTQFNTVSQEKNGR